ncbi:MAG TPA: hypothetical protein VFF73_15930 [Planctomycetota bacterium]|nr:hypothetical protein [Planctomycetota bacterium]
MNEAHEPVVRPGTARCPSARIRIPLAAAARTITDILFVTPDGFDRHGIVVELEDAGFGVRVEPPTVPRLQRALEAPPVLVLFHVTPEDTSALEFVSFLARSTPLPPPCLAIVERGDVKLFDRVLACAVDAISVPVAPSLLRVKALRALGGPRVADRSAVDTRTFGRKTVSQERVQSYLLPDLLREGRSKLEALGAGETVAATRSTTRIPVERRIEACLADAARRLVSLARVAFFKAGRLQTLELAAVHPLGASTASLEMIAADAWRGQECLLGNGRGTALGAVPVVLPRKPLGVLVAESAAGALGRGHLALLAALGERLAQRTIEE